MFVIFAKISFTFVFYVLYVLSICVLLMMFCSDRVHQLLQIRTSNYNKDNEDTYYQAIFLLPSCLCQKGHYQITWHQSRSNRRLSFKSHVCDGTTVTVSMREIYNYILSSLVDITLQYIGTFVCPCCSFCGWLNYFSAAHLQHFF